MSATVSEAATFRPAALIELLKPVTWFAPMWAYGCGVVSSGQSVGAHWTGMLAGMLLAGPLVCGTSQAVNDWYDRHVDAINEPGRPIPSGRIPGRMGFWVAVVWSVVSLVVAGALGVWTLGAACVGLVLAWVYSAPPVRLKMNGWCGNAAVGLCYEGLPWFTGAAVMAGGALPDGRVLALAGLYSLGAHGIMTLNDFKSVAGDVAMGVRSLPVQLGVDRAARLACWVMALPQVAVAALLWRWGYRDHGVVLLLLLGLQFALMPQFLIRPAARAIFYNSTGTTLYVLGMLASAFALAQGSGS